MKAKAAAILLKQSVTDAEARTDVDLVVVLRRSSGSYNDLSLAFASLCALAWLLYVVYAPADFNEMWWPVEVTTVYVFAYFLFGHLPWRRHLPLKRRFQHQVHSAARMAFVGHGIDRTHSRLGVLIYVSALENEARILPDQNAQAHLSPGKLAEFQERLSAAWSRANGDPSGVCAVLKDFGNFCAIAFPRTKAVHELSDEVDVTDGEAL